ncbi:MAG: RrF2 family transcriptional regulator [Planctomycetota bacterium]
MFSQTTKICLKSLAFLVTKERGSVVQSSEIAGRVGVSPTYVTKVFQPLCRQGWLRSIKGRTGGWVLDKDPSKLTLAQTVLVLDPEQQWRRCVIGHEICSGETACPFHDTWVQAIEDFQQVMEATTLDRLPEFLPPCFDGRRDVQASAG